MNRALIYAAGIVAAGLLAGCQTIPPGAERGPHGTMAYDVLIEASAPGARIEANGQVLGNTPLHLKIFGDPDGTFHDFGSPEYVIEAFPLRTNQFVQTAVFRTGHLFSGEDRIPRRIYFDMNKPPPPYGAPAYGSSEYYGPSVYFYGPPVYFGPRFYGGPRFYYHRRHW